MTGGLDCVTRACCWQGGSFRTELEKSRPDDWILQVYDVCIGLFLLRSGLLGGGASNWEPPTARPLSHFPTRSMPVNAIVEKVRYRTRVALLLATTFCTTTLRVCGRKATQESPIPSGPCQGTKSFGQNLTGKYVQSYEVIEADDLL